MLSHFSRVWLFVTPWTVTHQAPLSMGIFRQGYQSELLCPPPGDLPPRDWTCVSCIAGRIFYLWSTREALELCYGRQNNAVSQMATSCTLVPMSAAAAAKLRQSCPTLCDPIDGSPPGSAVPGIHQARTLDWVAISSSNAWKWKVKVKSLSCVRLLATPWTAAYQAPPSIGFSKSIGVGCHCLLWYLWVCHHKRDFANMKMVRTLRFLLDHLNGQNPITNVLKIRETLPSVFRVRDKCDYRKMIREMQHCWLWR